MREPQPLGAQPLISEFKRWVEREVGVLIQDQPLGFSHDDLARRLGATYRSGGAHERRLRTQVQRLCERGYLMAPVPGVFIAGRNLSSQTAKNIGCAIDEHFAAAGGVLSMSDLCTKLGCAAPVARGALWNSGRYFTGLPLEGHRRLWLLNDEERRDLPLPGQSQLLELQIYQLRAGKCPQRPEVISAAEGLRLRIALAVRDARLLRGASVDELVNTPNLSAALMASLERLSDTAIVDQELAQRYGTVGAWWKSACALPSSDALEALWRAVEGEGAAPRLQEVLDVRCWEAVGKVLGCNPAWLSRGALVPAA